MTKQQLSDIREWFASFVQGFADTTDGARSAMQLKVEHSERVAREMAGLATDLGWSSADRNTAEALGLLHDAGRFPQFAGYGTFSDAASVDHGELGHATVSGAAVLDALAAPDRNNILLGIRHHNARALPRDLPTAARPLVQLIRDADKLDIFEIVLAAVEKDGFRELPRMMPAIDLDRACSPAVLAEIRAGRTCSLQNVRSLQDFLVMQLSWTFDLTTIPAVQRVADRHIVGRILSHLPQEPDFAELGARMDRTLRARLGS